MSVAIRSMMGWRSISVGESDLGIGVKSGVEAKFDIPAAKIVSIQLKRLITSVLLIVLYLR